MSLLLAAGFAACNNDGFEVGEVDLGYLKLISSDVSFDYCGGTGQIIADTKESVNAIKAEDGSSNWISVSVDKNVVSVTAEENIGTRRNTYVTLISGGRRKVVAISQGEGVLTIKEASLSFNSLPTASRLADSRAFNYSLLGSMLLSASDNVDWITSVTLERETGVATVNATGNATATPRTGVVTLTLGDQKKTITVTQAAAAIFTDRTSLTFTHEAGSQQIAFDVPSGDATVTSSHPWAMVSINNATRIVTVNVGASTNVGARNATVTIKYGDLTKEVSVRQTPPPATN